MQLISFLNNLQDKNKKNAEKTNQELKILKISKLKHKKINYEKNFYNQYYQKQQKQKQSQGQQQISNYKEYSYTKKQPIKNSPYYQKYMQIFLKYQNLSKITQFQQNFLQLQIKQSYLPALKFQIQIFSQSHTSKIIVYNAKLRNFEFKITTLNLNKNDGFNLNFNDKFDEGMFGIAYSVKYDNKNYIVKKILLRNQNQKSKQIHKSIKQYAFMKIFSVFQAAPSIQSIYGFDLIINEDSIMFSMEKGVEILKYFQSLQTNNIKQNIQKSFDDLRKSLLLLHSFNITHNDIKPENMVFSPSKNKLVFIDFGLSQVNSQKQDK